jgi:hypothetical protein
MPIGILRMPATAFRNLSFVLLRYRNNTGKQEILQCDFCSRGACRMRKRQIGFLSIYAENEAKQSKSFPCGMTRWGDNKLTESEKTKYG